MLRLKCADPTGQEDMHVALSQFSSLFLWRCEIGHTDLVDDTLWLHCNYIIEQKNQERK